MSNLIITKNKKHIHIYTQTTWLCNVVINVFIDPQTFLLNKILVKFGSLWGPLNHKTQYNSVNYFSMQWDSNNKPTNINFVEQDHGKITGDKKICLTYEGDEPIFYEDNLGNYWDKNEFTINNPTNYERTLSILCSTYLELLTSMSDILEDNEKGMEYQTELYLKLKSEYVNYCNLK